MDEFFALPAYKRALLIANSIHIIIVQNEMKGLTYQRKR